MGFSPIVLFDLGQEEANRIVSRCVNSFDWVFIFFYGDEVMNKPISLSDIKNNITDLAYITEGKILFLDFLPTNGNFRTYLYSKWREHCPPQLLNESIISIQRCFELGVTAEKRTKLEYLFYQSLFKDEDFEPCLVLINTYFNYIVKRNFIRQDIDATLFNEILTGLSFIQSRGNEYFSDRTQIAQFLKPKTMTNKESIFLSSTICKLDVAIADFLDKAEDIIFDIDLQDTDDFGVLKKIRTTKKFNKQFSMLADDIKRLTEKAIENLLMKNFSGLGLEKIKLTNQLFFHRMRINNKYRIHFQGTPEEPILINVGPHKLYEFGYMID